MQLHDTIATPAPKTGVIICQCGQEIAGRLDVEALQRELLELPQVGLVHTEPYPCSKDGRARLQRAIQENELERVLVAGCTPRLVEPMFQASGQTAGLRPGDIALANIREGCVYVHENDGDAALERARRIITMGIAQLGGVSHRKTYTQTIAQSAVVIGGGIAGFTAALTLADHDIPVRLFLEAEGESNHSHRQEWANDLLRTQVAAVHEHPKIRRYVGTTITAVDGPSGRLRMTFEQGQDQRSCETGVVLLAGDGHEKEPGIFTAHPSLNKLASLFRVPQDENGFLFEPHMRVRPDRNIDDGVYCFGEAHQPVAPDELLLQAYVVSGRALRFLRRETLTRSSPVVEVAGELCTGCARCLPTCPTQAIRLEAGNGLLRQASIEWTRCLGCGNCVVACPVGCLTLPEWEEAPLMATIQAALAPLPGANGQDGHAAPSPRILVFACDWSAYAAADLAGSNRMPYAPGVSLVRLNCSARFTPMMALWAFIQGADGVLVGACGGGDCHYGVGSIYAGQRVELLQRQLTLHGIDPRRLRFETYCGDDGAGFARSVNEFAELLSRTPPLFLEAVASG